MIALCIYAGLKSVRHTILDVQSTSWHDEYLLFRTGVKELEVMVQNVIKGIFTTVTTVEEGVEILEVFTDMASREVSYIHVDCLYAWTCICLVSAEGTCIY